MCKDCYQLIAWGCQDHHPNFAFMLKVETSQIAGAGQGVVNHDSTIPIGVLFGLYQALIRDKNTLPLRTSSRD